jgi:very-short-patch-repair endonuclease
VNRTIIHYRPDLKEKSRELRKRCTASEKILWRHIRRKQLKGFRFYRQKPIDKYIVDFFCFELMLAVEIDGITHNDKAEYDKIRDECLNKNGITVLHFYDQDIHENITGVLETLLMWIENSEKTKE